jgi:thymidylate synthase
MTINTPKGMKMKDFKLPSYEDFYLYHLHILTTKLKEQGTTEDRTGTGTARMFGSQIRCDLRTDFPLLTTKKVFTRGVIEEMLWFLRGETNVKALVDAHVHIWDGFHDKFGDLGPVYGAQWRNWNDNGTDQIAELIDQLKNDPNSRRMIVSAWNPEVLPDTKFTPAENASCNLQALPPCHTMFQCSTEEMTAAEKEQNPGVERWLDLQLYQRSADWFLGVPFNAVSYSLLTMLLAHHVGMKPRFFIHTFGDLHLYGNHLEQAELQLTRQPSEQRPLVALLNFPETPLHEITAADICIHNYHPEDAIKAPVSI